MTITIIGNTTGHAAHRLSEEAKKQDLALQLVSVESLILTVHDDTFKLSCSEYGDITQSDCYIFRGIGSADQEMMVISKYLTQHGATIIEEKTATGALMMDKLFLQATDKLVPTPNYVMIQSKQALEEIAGNIDYPTVMKSTIGSMGKNVVLIHNEQELFEQFSILGTRVIIQKYYNVNHDVRAIVIDGHCIGAYRRTRSDGEFRMNRPGSDKERTTLPPEAVAVCERAAITQNIEIAGVDIIEHQGKWYVLEVNTAPQFKKFEEYTGVNVAKHIINYAQTKVARRAQAPTRAGI